MRKWKKLKTSLVFDSKYLKVRRDVVLLPNGNKREWTYWDSKDSAMVVGMTKSKKLVMIRQYRYLVAKEVIEFPSGSLRDKETPLAGAKREFEEETGYRCGKIIKLGSFYETYGQLNRKIHIFFTNKVTKTKQTLDSGARGFEEIEVKLVEVNQALHLAVGGEVDAMGSSLAILLLSEKINNGEIEI